MPRRYRRRYARVSRPLKTVKYSSETTNFYNPITFAAGETLGVAAIMIAAVDGQGMRKVKNCTLHIETTVVLPLAFALIYLPQGRDLANQPLNIGSARAPAALYEPNQNVILSGVVSNNSPQLTFRNRLARNLNSGDSIALIIKPIKTPTEEVNGEFYASLNYAISY